VRLVGCAPSDRALLSSTLLFCADWPYINIIFSFYALCIVGFLDPPVRSGSRSPCLSWPSFSFSDLRSCLLFPLFSSPPIVLVFSTFTLRSALSVRRPFAQNSSIPRGKAPYLFRRRAFQHPPPMTTCYHIPLDIGTHRLHCTCTVNLLPLTLSTPRCAVARTLFFPATIVNRTYHLVIQVIPVPPLGSSPQRSLPSYSTFWPP